jgi:FkbM family methyltransferase
MKLLELKRLNFSLACKVFLAYIGKKLLHVKLVGGQDELISYYNFLINSNARHLETVGKYNHVETAAYGSFYLRKPFSSDYKVFDQIFLKKEYSFLADAIKKYCPGPDINFLDGGANIGFTTIYINHHLQGIKKIKSVLIEPFADNIELARLNIESRKIDRTIFEKAGLHNKNCFLKLVKDFRDGMEWSIQIVESAEPTDLRSVELNEICSKYFNGKLNVLKLDIEGGEKFLFADEAYAASFLSKTDIIAIELHEEYVNIDKVVQILTQNNFTLHKYGEMHVGIKNHLVNNNEKN